MTKLDYIYVILSTVWIHYQSPLETTTSIHPATLKIIVSILPGQPDVNTRGQRTLGVHEQSSNPSSIVTPLLLLISIRPGEDGGHLFQWGLRCGKVSALFSRT